MPARARPAAALTSLVSSDSESDFGGFRNTASRPKSSVKPARGRPANSNRVSKPLASAPRRRLSNGSTNSVNASSRQVLADRSNLNGVREEPSLDDMDLNALTDDDERPPRKGRNARPATKEKSRTATSKRARDAHVLDVSSWTNDAMDMNEEVQQHLEANAYDEGVPPASTLRETHTDNTEYDHGLNDVSLRRRLGDLSKKHEALETRYRDLQEVGVREAERNFDRLKRQAEENTAASRKLVQQLKDELATQNTQLKQEERNARQLASSEARAETLQSKVDELSQSLSDARAEIKTLSTKLSASRNAEASIKAPGSALKANSAARAPPSEIVQTAQAKEDLYGDLTGLIVRGLKRGEKEDVFDCIQTGRNGTLHFKLGLENADLADGYEGVQFTYRPQLDEDRDSDLMELLPDYLVEEITFPRTHASKFYARVIKSLTERLD